LLQKAYIDARYNPKYKITTQELEYPGRPGKEAPEADEADLQGTNRQLCVRARCALLKASQAA